MGSFFKKRYAICVLLSLLLMTVNVEVNAQTKKGRKATATAMAGKGKKGGAAQSGKGRGKGSERKNKSAQASQKGKKGEVRTSAEVKKLQEATQQEIRRTRQQIAENDRSIAKGIKELQKLEGDIGETRKEVNTITQKVNLLKRNIDTLETRIKKEEGRLTRMREDYKKAVKKMRISKRGNSTLAFLFSSGSFSEAMRRMRYLKTFSEWKDKQTKEIMATVATLKTEREALALSQREHGVALNQQLAAKSQLEHQHAEQDRIVVELKKNGEALNSHLARKQAEANQLNGQIATLIAREEAKKAEQARKAEEQRLAREAAAKEKAAREKAAQEKAERLAQEKAAQEKAAKEKTEKKETVQEKSAKNEVQKKETQKKEVQKKDTEVKDKSTGNDKKNYAEARRRKPRSENNAGKRPVEKNDESRSTQKPGAKTESTPSTKGGDGFESMKGALPRPVAGQFKVVSRFGRQTLPDLPGVEYDNPGIDVEVAKGASVQAVYPGTVSAVYVVPGFSTVVIVSHGTYYTVYGNLSSANVKGGDAVKSGQKLGVLATDSDNPGHSMLHFEVWKKRDKLNPLNWIK